MEDTIGSFKFCRVCLVPEETEIFTSVYEDNGKIALKIHKFFGIMLLDVDGKVPSLICQKCIEDIEAVETLKMRILDADEYYAMITMESEQRFLDVEMKELINKQTFKTPQSKKKKVERLIPELINIKIKQEPIDNENTKPRKRKLETDYDDVVSENINTSGHNSKVMPSKPFLPKATPNKLGIHRMVIKTKAKASKSNITSYFKPQTSSTPAPTSMTSSKKKKSFRPKLNVGSSKSKSKRRNSNNGQKKTVTFECDNCKKTFESYQSLNDHLVEHKFEEPFSCTFCEDTFANDEYLQVHIEARHTKEVFNE